MSIPVASDVYGRVRSILSDNEVAGGDLFTDAFLANFLQEAVNGMFRALHHAESPLIERTRYYKLPAGQDYLDLDAAGMGRFAEMISVRAKTVKASGTITGVAYGSSPVNNWTGWDLTSVAHGRATGQRLYVYGVTNGIDDLINSVWKILWVDADTFRLIGSPNKTNGAFSATGAETWVFSEESDWSFPFNQVDGMQSVADSYTSWREPYDIREGALRFTSLDSADRLLELKYREKPDELVAAGENLRVRGSLDYLARMTAALAALSQGATEAGIVCLGIATGAQAIGMVDWRSPGGLLGDLAQEHATASRQVVQSQRYKPRRGRRW